ncbi:MAG: hypothetical protein AUK47_09315 [Deltaproteobacteria bacterium CG2_30_63_29]|nr:MAG: hypothetical protein AUK47_09315 [Deltaproteobacteria bacterium CG2_30_63_29]PJB37603.1 MAG: hypothetical protein CO108_20785 [Deltaproteobacteria bacterium CG_4_9_14_3_um_filter_63_12]
MKSTFFILLTTALLSCSHKTPESPSGDQSAPAPAKTADAASQQETGCSGELVFESQEPRAPKLVRGAGGWLVGWLDDGTVAKAMLSTQARAERCEPPFTLSDNAEALALAANGDAVVALWFEPSAGGSNGLIKGGRVDLKSGLVTVNTYSDPKLNVGPAELLAFEDGFVAAWVEGERSRAVKLDAAGAVVAEATWWGGNEHPEGPINPIKGQRAQPHLERPTLSLRDGELVVSWFGDFWESDDMVGWERYFATIKWGEKDQEGMPLGIMFPVWGELAAFDGERRLERRHDRNGGPWELYAHFGTTEPVLVTSEDAGPLTAFVRADGEQTWIVWKSPSRNGLVTRRAQKDGTLTDPVVFPLVGLSTETEFAVGLYDGKPWFAYTDRVDGKVAVRVAALPSQTTDANLEKLGRSGVYAAEKESPDYVGTAQLEDGRAFIGWKDYWAQGVSGLWLDKDGLPEGKLVKFPSQARCSGPSVAPLGEKVLVTYDCCQDKASCSDPSIFWSVTSWGEASPTAEAIVADKEHYTPILALRLVRNVEDPGAAEQLEASLVMTKGGYTRHIVERRVRVGSVGELASALKAADERVVKTDAVATASAWVGDQLVILGHPTLRSDRPSSNESMLWKVTDDGVDDVLALTNSRYPVWGVHRMLAVDGGLVVAGQRVRIESADVILYHLDASMQLTGTTVLAKNSDLRAPNIAAADGRIAVAWYDGNTDGDYVSIVEKGSRIWGPYRLDDAAVRASSGNPAIFPLESGWRFFWTDPQRLQTSRRE